MDNSHSQVHAGSPRSWSGKPLSPCTYPLDWFAVRFSLRAWIGEGLSLSANGGRRDHFCQVLDWDGPIPLGLNIDVLALDPGHVSMCTLSAGRVYVSACDPEHLLTQSLFK